MLYQFGFLDMITNDYSPIALYDGNSVSIKNARS